MSQQVSEGNMDGSRLPGNPSIGEPISFAAGQFAGRTLRAELCEVQKANLGRKYTRKDRRPLDPPPVVALKLFEISKSGAGVVEKEFDHYKYMDTLSLLCHVDLFPIPQSRSNSQAAPLARKFLPLFSSLENEIRSLDHPAWFSSTKGLSSSAQQCALPGQTAGTHGNGPVRRTSGVATDYNGLPIAECDRCTADLAGSTVAEAVCMDHKGKTALMFIFSDLSVRKEGSFVLRYRTFDIMSKVADYPTDIPVLAECWSGPFQVFSTKTFPGLEPSTDLTRHIARYGVRVNSRETDRRKRRQSDVDPSRDMRREPLRIAPFHSAPETASSSLSPTSPVSPVTSYLGTPGRRRP
ncbi:uncharacterized protein LAESUDRAFT_754645 [Laetiporus sulphureus 93-53]|uniref:Velvet domain-containing protein n=1 Tax=Laetiporus sulphureus 93-53 TaxID=1314785 RepID=A0A165HT43_9APHY|nr:uncharacterized protein LAESUDRAFT_754645 [Laetiporus sulphureus 93-53]KZT12151.1 hypothetical protein LAESUDRAFT_754645 [Laetiporus sulphureus 93-53]